MCSKNRQMCPQNRQMCPLHCQMCSKNLQMCSQNLQMCPQNYQMYPLNRQMCFQNRQMCPQNYHMPTTYTKGSRRKSYYFFKGRTTKRGRGVEEEILFLRLKNLFCGFPCILLIWSTNLQYTSPVKLLNMHGLWELCSQYTFNAFYITKLIFSQNKFCHLICILLPLFCLASVYFANIPNLKDLKYVY